MGDPRKADSARPPAVTRPAIRKTGAPPEELPRYALPALAPPPARVDDDGEQTRAFETGEQATRMFEAERPTNQQPAKVKLPTPSGPPQSPWARPSSQQLPSPDTDRQLSRLDEDDDLSTSPAHVPPRFSNEEATMSRSDLLVERPAPQISDADWNQTLTAVPRERVSSAPATRGLNGESLDPVSESEVLSTGDFQLRTSHADDDEVTRGAIELPSKPVMPVAKIASAPPRGLTPNPPPSRPPPRRAAAVEPPIPEPVITAPILEAPPPSNRPLAQARTQPVQAEDPYAAYRNAQAAAALAPSYAPATPAFTPVSAAARTAPPTSRAATPRSGVAKADSPRYLLWIAYGLLVGGFGVLFGAQFINSKPEEEAAPTKGTATSAQAAPPVQAPVTPGAMPMQPGVIPQPGAMPMQQVPGAMPMQPGMMPQGAMPQGAYPQYGQQGAMPQGAMPQGAYPQYGQQGAMPQGAYPQYGQQPAQPGWSQGNAPQQPAPQTQKSHTTVATRPAAPAAPRTPKAPDEAPQPKTPAKGSAAAADILGDGL